MKKETQGFKSDVLSKVSVELKKLGIGEMRVRELGTGSVGFNHSGKVTIDNIPYQVGLNVTLCHSKPSDPKRLPQAEIDSFLENAGPQDLKTLGLANQVALAREFSTGKVGFYHSGKVNIAGKSCQVGLNVTAVGSDKWDEAPPAEREA